MDPIAEEYPNQTPYQFASNNPVWKIELEGLEGFPTTEEDFINGLGYGVDPGDGTAVQVGEGGILSEGYLSSALGAVGDFFGSIHDGLSGAIESGFRSVMGTAEPSTVMSASEFNDAIVSGDENAVYSGLEADAAALYNAVPEVAGEVGAMAVEAAIGELMAGAKVTPKTSVKSGGRLGNTKTRAQNSAIADELEARGYEITGGGGRAKEEYLRPIGGGRKGGSYPDITAKKDGQTIRINTVDTKKSGAMTKREAENAARIRAQRPYDHLLTVPKSQ